MDSGEIPVASLSTRIDEVCDRFERDWTSGHRTRIEELLIGIERPERVAYLRELLLIELELNGRTASKGMQAEYERRFADEVDVVRAVFREMTQVAIPIPEAADFTSPGTLSSALADPPAADHPIKIHLDVVAGPHRGACFELERHETFLVGRAAEASLCLSEDPRISRYHFRLEVNPPECYLADLGSRNGTFVNGQRVQECQLKHGDLIAGGGTQIRLSLISAGQPRADGEDIATFMIDQTASNLNESDPGTLAKSGELLLAPADFVPGYELCEEIGRGGMGVVYRAIQKKTQRECALKIIIPERLASEQSLQVFLREASILSQLNHPCIVRFSEVGTVKGQFFLAMEYVRTVPSGPLLESERLSGKVRLACGVLCQVLDALHYAHLRDVVHRDVKPGNILLTRSADKLLAKLADFGLAKNYTNAGFSGITRLGDLRGSLSYMPPEQIVNCRFATPACDIYSAGATLYRFLTGALPYDFSGSKGAFAAVLENDPVPLVQRRPDLPPDLSAIVIKAMQKKPADRFATAEAMQQALLPFAEFSEPFKPTS